MAAAHRRCIMLTDEQLADQLRTQLRREVATVQPSGDLLKHLHRRQSRRSPGLQLSIVAVPAGAAAVVAAFLVVTGGGGRGAGTTKTNAVLTAAMVQRMASQSRLSLAHSGRGKIDYSERSNGALQEKGTYDIAFGGKNWNAALSETFPARNGQPASTQTAINRIVDGKFYLHTVGRNGRLEWIRDTNPTG